MTKKVWKDFLLSSGLPLEYSVKKILEELGAISPDEYSYERLNEHGLPGYFSVDINAITFGNTITDLVTGTQFLIECKYRHENVKWVFTPQKTSYLLPEKDEAFITLDTIAESKKIDTRKVKKFLEQYEVCRKGVEILDDAFNPKGFEQSLYQLKFAVVEQIISTLVDDQLVSSMGSKNIIWTIIPIVVTTAELWRIREDATLEDIKGTTELSEIADKRDAIFLYQPPDKELSKFTKGKFKERLSKEEKDQLNMIYQKNGNVTFTHQINIFADYVPSYFLVINYNKVKFEIKKIIDLLKDQSIYINKEPKKNIQNESEIF